MISVDLPVISFTMISVTTLIRLYVTYAGKASVKSWSKAFWRISPNSESTCAAATSFFDSPSDGKGATLCATAFAYSTALIAFWVSKYLIKTGETWGRYRWRKAANLVNSSGSCSIVSKCPPEKSASESTLSDVGFFFRG